jgi:stress-induced morphogen
MSIQGVSSEELKTIIISNLPAEKVLLWDESANCGTKFRVVIVAQKFEGMKLLDRQRAVNEAIKEPMKRIHAFSMRTWTPSEYQEKKDPSWE